jgi:hypothetical protein
MTVYDVGTTSSRLGEQPPAEAGHDGHPHGDPKEALGRVGSLIAEYKEYLSYYLATKADGAKLSIRNIGVYAGLGVVGLIAASAVITTAVVLLLAGAAVGLGRLLWDQLWLGSLIVGLLVLGGICTGVYVGLKRFTGASRKRTVEKYEQRQNWQYGQFGRSVREQAAAGQRH